MIAIHESNVGFHERWINYCKGNNIPFKLVDCYATDIIDQLTGCKALLWHHNHALSTDQLIAKSILFSLYHSGFTVFPDFQSNWHFDDKIAQKYLLESLDVPHVPTDIFYSKDKALKWIANESFPKVFKLRKGAGSKNVMLVRKRSEAVKLVKKSFGKGFRLIDGWSELKETFRKYRLGKANWKILAKAIVHLYYPYNVEKYLGREKGYSLFQEFIPKNQFDIRVIVINDKAFAIKRNVRKGDFRASGSGFIEYDKALFKDEWIELSFSHAAKLKARCVAFDYIFKDNIPLVVEISYGFSAKGYDPCPGYWTRNLTWHEGSFNPYGWMIEDLLKSSR